MVSINYWVEHQCVRSSMPDTSRMVPAIKGDRAGRPGIKFGGDELNSVYVSEYAFARSLWNVSYVNHIYCFDFWWEFFLSSIVRRPGLFLVIAVQPLVIVFGN